MSKGSELYKREYLQMPIVKPPKATCPNHALLKSGDICEICMQMVPLDESMKPILNDGAFGDWYFDELQKEFELKEKE